VQIFPHSLDPVLRPRVLLYASNNLQAQINSLGGFQSDPDCQAVSISSKNFNFNLINVYNEDDQRGLLGCTIERVLLPKHLPLHCLVLGDFNTHDLWWDPLCTSTSLGAASFIELTENQGLDLLNTLGIGTFFRPNMARESVLDLSFATRSLVGKIQDWQVITGLGSDHYRLLFTIKSSTQENVPLLKALKFNTKLAK
jgi:hypothetical protein